MSCATCGVAESATKRIRSEKRSNEMRRLAIICGSFLLAVAMVCATVLACYSVKKQQETIIEQQYALNMQYASLMDYISGAEITESTAEADNGGAAVIGDGNTVTGG